jgi:hypothetical protein
MTAPTDADAQVTEEMVLRASRAYRDTINEGDGDLMARHARAMRAALSAALAGGDGWVSVKERMPEPDTQVLVFRIGRCRTGYWSTGSGARWWIDGGPSESIEHSYTTHWRPLPNPPALDATREGA